MSLSDALNKWAASKAGKEKIGKAQADAARLGKPFGGKPAGGAAHSPDFYEAEMIRLITECAAQYDHEYGDYLQRVSMVWDTKTNRWVIHLEFDPIRSRRESWYVEGYPEGVDIVEIMNRGYTASRRVFLKSPSKQTLQTSRLSYDGEFFVQAAVAQFNDMYGIDAIADYNHDKFDRKT